MPLYRTHLHSPQCRGASKPSNHAIVVATVFVLLQLYQPIRDFQYRSLAILVRLLWYLTINGASIAHLTLLLPHLDLFHWHWPGTALLIRSMNWASRRSSFLVRVKSLRGKFAAAFGWQFRHILKRFLLVLRGNRLKQFLHVCDVKYSSTNFTREWPSL